LITSAKTILWRKRRVAQAIYQRIGGPSRFPNVAESVLLKLVSAWPCIAVYETFDDQVHVLRIRHAAQDLP
jgi:plasmid stabilization system protein ParE